MGRNSITLLYITVGTNRCAKLNLPTPFFTFHENLVGEYTYIEWTLSRMLMLIMRKETGERLADLTNRIHRLEQVADRDFQITVYCK